KAQRQHGELHDHLLRGKTLAMIFQKPSTRTRVAFEAGMAQLGGHALFLSTNDLQLGRGETISDTAQVLSRYVDGIMARVFKHSDVQTLAEYSTVPVINGLSDLAHPTQGLADMLTVKEQLGGWSGHKLTYVGCANNMAHSLMLAGALVGLDICIASPASVQPDPDIFQRACAIGAMTGATITVADDPRDGVADANLIYTDVWVSMGQTVDEGTLKALAGFQVNDGLMEYAGPDALFMHCLPMYRGQEATAEVADGHYSIIFDQAENRLHLHKALMVALMSDEVESVLL
ncbi:MAG TPA: ornithine carbamoyltransferase, partial [Thermomicrobiaceae bacterium]|nr:ornithine carbamoyltransferase [Thermomicrobiaceae bacterium]